MSEEEFNDHKTAREQFEFFNSTYAFHPLMKSFSRDKAILLVFNSNKLENTLPNGAKRSNTYKLLNDVTLDSPSVIP